MSLTAAALLVLASGTSGAATQPSPAKPAEQAQEDDPMVCQSDHALGSRIKRKRICMKRSEWERQRQENKQMIDRTQILRNTVPSG